MTKPKRWDLQLLAEIAVAGAPELSPDQIALLSRVLRPRERLLRSAVNAADLGEQRRAA